MLYDCWAVSIIPKLKIEVEEEASLCALLGSVRHGLHKNMWPAKSRFGYLFSLLKDFGLADVHSPLKKGETHRACCRDGDNKVGYLEPSPEVGREHARTSLS